MPMLSCMLLAVVVNSLYHSSRVTRAERDMNGRASAYYLQLAAISTILLIPLGNDRILRGWTINRRFDEDGDGKGRSKET